MYRSLNKLHT